MMQKEMTKSLPVSKRMVWNSYLKVSSKQGGAGIDRQSIEQFDEEMAKNLYKLWNRMASGCYFPPPVRTVLIPKKQGGLRPLGIPTVTDRIAQGVVKDYLEPSMEAIFHPSSFGYRPGKSAHDALAQCRANCISKAWVVDIDIKGFFDNISHSIMMELLGGHTQEKWILMYVERWLKAGVEQADGCILARTQGTPQGGVVSPLLANIYLHHAFDTWMDIAHAGSPFERYADDIVIHCDSKEQAKQILSDLQERMRAFDLTLHPEKTKIVFCKNYKRNERFENESFTFLSYSFQPRTIKNKFTAVKRLLIFSPAICNNAKTSIRTSIKEVIDKYWCSQTLASFAKKLNPKIRGWINYYAKYHKDKAHNVFYYLNGLIRDWIKNTYKITGKDKLYKKYQQIQADNPALFYHWEKGIKA
jgi:RNA-directed DNA polymerase